MDRNPFLRVPTEVRLMIFNHLPLAPDYFSMICASKETCAEAIEAFYSSSTFRISLGESITISTRGSDSGSESRVKYTKPYSDLQQTPYLKLIRHLDVEIDCIMRVDSDASTFFPDRYILVEEVAERIRNMSLLKTLRVFPNSSCASSEIMSMAHEGDGDIFRTAIFGKKREGIENSESGSKYASCWLESLSPDLAINAHRDSGCQRYRPANIPHCGAIGLPSLFATIVPGTTTQIIAAHESSRQRGNRNPTPSITRIAAPPKPADFGLIRPPVRSESQMFFCA
ncbi:hypothetical protein BT63DRAFT_419016 [Microthyrium microscopicum]|uniref:Uncharacterized protein n=1 Tax=Microthyrium microscopicum TaxID=703497 RepID=A0A6A6TVR5_9PEZI|nr:hypothetical protein BT63DRAFT_419016 [Microthyrium microscopicum]